MSGPSAEAPAEQGLEQEAQPQEEQRLSGDHLSRAFFGAVVFSIMLDEIRPAVGGGFSLWSTLAVSGALLIAAATLPRLRADHAARGQTSRGVLTGLVLMLGSLGLGILNVVTQSSTEPPLHTQAMLLTWILGAGTLALPWRSEKTDQALNTTGILLGLTALLGRWLL